MNKKYYFAITAFLLFFLYLYLSSYIYVPSFQLKYKVLGFILLSISVVSGSIFFLKSLKTKRIFEALAGFVVVVGILFVGALHAIPSGGFLCSEGKIVTLNYPQYNKTIYVVQHHCVPDGSTNVYVADDFWPVMEHLAFSPDEYWGQQPQEYMNQQENLLLFDGLIYRGNKLKSYNLSTGEIITEP